MSMLMKIYNEYGGINQLDKLIEELKEALEEATKLRAIVEKDDDINAENITLIAQELADVDIVFSQFIFKFDMLEEYTEFMKYKLERQLRRIRNGK